MGLTVPQSRAQRTIRSFGDWQIACVVSRSKSCTWILYIWNTGITSTSLPSNSFTRYVPSSAGSIPVFTMFTPTISRCIGTAWFFAVSHTMKSPSRSRYSGLIAWTYFE